MAVANLVIKVSGQMTELENDLKKTSDLLGDFGKSFDTTSQKAAKAQDAITRSFSGEKVISQAAQIVTAVDKIGGSSKLTADEMARVNKSVSDAIDKYKALGQTAPPAMLALAQATEKVPEKLSRVDEALTGVGSHFASTLAAFVSAQAIIGGVERAFDGLKDFVADSVKAFADAEAASRRLAVAVQTQGLGIPGLVDKYHDLAEEYQRTTSFSHDAVTEAEALFVQLGGVGPQQMDKALRAATDLSSGLGIDLTSSVTLVAKAFEGQTSSLQRYGIVLDQAKIKSEGIDYVLGAIEDKVGGQAQAELDTYAGKIKKIGNAWEDLKEEVGKGIVTDPSVQKLLDLLTHAGDRASESKATLSDTLADTLFGNIGAIPVHAVNAAIDEVDTAIKQVTQDANDAFAAMQRTFGKPAFAQALDRVAKDPFADLKSESKAFADQTVSDWDRAEKAAKAAAEAFAADVLHIQQSLTHQDLDQQAKKLAAAFQGLRPSQITLDLVKRVGDEAADLIVKGGHVPQLLQDITLATGAMHDPLSRADLDFKNIGKTLRNEVSPEFDAIVAKIIAANPAFEQTARRLNEIFNANRTGLTPDLFKNIGTQLEKEAPPAVNALGKIIGDELPKFIADAFEEGWSKGVNKAMDELGASLGGHLFGNLQQPITSGLSKVLGDSMGAAIGLALPVIGSALFAGLSQLLTDPKTGHGWLHEILWGREGRNEVEDFVTQVYGSFDALHQQLLALGAEGEQLWKQLTQGVGRRDTAAADAAIAAIQNALPSALTQAAGYQTVAQLQDAAQKAEKIWEYMRDSGQYTADEIADAFQKAQDAIAKTGDTTYSSLTKAHDAATQQLQDLDAQIQSLQASIADEAPEAVMGVIEQQARARIAALEDERQAAANHLDQLTQDMTSSMLSVSDAIGKLPHEIAIRLQVELDTRYGPGPGSGSSDSSLPPSFASGTNGYQYFGGGTLAILHGWEKVVPLGQWDPSMTAPPASVPEGQLTGISTTAPKQSVQNTAVFNRGAFEGVVVDNTDRVRQLSKQIRKEIRAGGSERSEWLNVLGVG